MTFTKGKRFWRVWVRVYVGLEEEKKKQQGWCKDLVETFSQTSKYQDI
jgi:hypothetical protein